MNKGTNIDLGLKGYDELFMDDRSRAEAKLPRIHDIPLDQIDDFPDHPFKVKLDEDMDQLVQSIKDRGIITPVTLRQKEDGRYEIVSGHRRKKACELAGMATVKAEIRDLTRDEAIILMVAASFPLVPYQFIILQKVMTEIRKHGNSGKHFSGAERSMLSASQEATQKMKDKDENALVPFYLFYDTLLTFLESSIRRVIDRCQTAADNQDGLEQDDVCVLKTLYLMLSSIL